MVIAHLAARMACFFHTLIAFPLPKNVSVTNNWQGIKPAPAEQGWGSDTVGPWVTLGKITNSLGGNGGNAALPLFWDLPHPKIDGPGLPGIVLSGQSQKPA